MAKFLKHLNLEICKYWYILYCAEQTKAHVNQQTENLYKSQSPTRWDFLQKTGLNLKNLNSQKTHQAFFIMFLQP